MRLGRLGSETLVRVQTELFNEKASKLRFSDLASLQISVTDLIQEEHELFIEPLAWGHLSIGIEHDQAEKMMKLLDSKDKATYLKSTPIPSSGHASPSSEIQPHSLLQETSSASSTLQTKESSPDESKADNLTLNKPIEEMSTTTITPIDTPISPHPSTDTEGSWCLNPLNPQVKSSASSSDSVPLTSMDSTSPNSDPSAASVSLTSTSPILTPTSIQTTSPTLEILPVQVPLPSPLTAYTWCSSSELLFNDDSPDRRFRLSMDSLKYTSRDPLRLDMTSSVHLGRYDSDATMLATEDLLLTLSRETEGLPPECIHSILGQLDVHHGTLFREFILNPENIEVCARQLYQLSKHVSMVHLAQVLAWMLSAENSETYQPHLVSTWPTLAIAKLLTILTIDATPDVAGMFFRLVWAKSQLTKATAIKVTSMMVQDESPSISALFVKTFSASWSLLHLAELISFLDCTLHWSESFFSQFMDRFFVYLGQDTATTSLPSIPMETLSSDVFQLNAAQVLGSHPQMRIVFLTTLYKTNLALNQMKIDYVSEQLRAAANAFGHAFHGERTELNEEEEEDDEKDEDHEEGEVGSPAVIERVRRGSEI